MWVAHLTSLAVFHHELGIGQGALNRQFSPLQRSGRDPFQLAVALVFSIGDATDRNRTGIVCLVGRGATITPRSLDMRGAGVEPALPVYKTGGLPLTDPRSGPGRT